MRVRDWPATTEINSSDTFIIDTGSGTKAVSFATLKSKATEGISTDTGGESSSPNPQAAFVTGAGSYPNGNTEWEGYRLWNNGILELWTGGKTISANPNSDGYTEHGITYPWRFDSAPTAAVFAAAADTKDSHVVNGGSSKASISWGVMSQSNKAQNRQEYYGIYIIGKCSAASSAVSS